MRLVLMWLCLVLIDVHVVVHLLGVFGQSFLVLLLGVHHCLALLEARVGLSDDLLLHFGGYVDSGQELLIAHVAVLLKVGPELLDHVAFDLGAESTTHLLGLLAEEVHSHTVSNLVGVFVAGAHLSLSRCTTAGHQGYPLTFAHTNFTCGICVFIIMINLIYGHSAINYC